MNKNKLESYRLLSKEKEIKYSVLIGCINRLSTSDNEGEVLELACFSIIHLCNYIKIARKTHKAFKEIEEDRQNEKN